MCEPNPSSGGLRNKNRNSPLGALLIVRVRRKRRHRELPEPGSFRLVLYLADPHRLHHGLIADLNIRIDAQMCTQAGFFGAPPCDPTST